MINDGFHSYTYDAEGNITQVSGGGTTAQYSYDALNNRVRAVVNGTATEFVFNASGQRVSTWNGSTYAQIQGQYYWGSQPVAFYENGTLHFQHQNWLGTERVRTSYNGAVEGTYGSLPFGDGQTTSGSDADAYHFATLDHDSETDTDHAVFRQYNNSQGRWMSPDPYDGSYDAANPQSFNRYAYVLNSPLSGTDSLGLQCDVWYGCGSNCANDPNCSSGDIPVGQGGVGGGPSLSDQESADEASWAILTGLVPGLEISDGLLLLGVPSQGVWVSDPSYNPDDPASNAGFYDFTAGWQVIGLASTILQSAFYTGTEFWRLPMTPGLPVSGMRATIGAAPPTVRRPPPTLAECILAPDAAIEIHNLVASQISNPMDDSTGGEGTDGVFMNINAHRGWEPMASAGAATKFNSAALALDYAASVARCKTLR